MTGEAREDAFVAAMSDAPTDDTVRLVYADWLEEQGDPRHEYLRLEVEYLRLSADGPHLSLANRLRDLRRTLDADWVALVGRVPPDPLDELRIHVPPPKRPYCAGGDWNEIEAAVGLRLPSDYKSYISTYGGGHFGHISVPSPFGRGIDIRGYLEGWASYYRDLTQWQEVPYPVYPEPGGLLPFGTFGDVDTLNWLTEGDPDHWPFVYHDREEGFIQVSGLTAVEFFLEAVTKRSPLLMRLRSNTGFDSPCEFHPDKVDPQVVRFVSHQPVDLERLVGLLTATCSAEQVRVRRSASGGSVQLEPLAGSVSFNTDTGDERIFASVYYDAHYAVGVERIVEIMTSVGFVYL